MYPRQFKAPPQQSFFLFGPRGVGKSQWLSEHLPDALTFDLLDGATFASFAARPERLEELIPAQAPDWVVVDEVQRVPDLLNQVHRLIEKRKLKFALSGSSARKIKRGNANLLAGRARYLRMFPLTAGELGDDFDLKKSLRAGHLPMAYSDKHPDKYLKDYVATYLTQEVQFEGLTRNLGAFSRFLETLSFSQAQPIVISEVARDAAIDRKTVENYVTIAEDLLLAERLPIFAKRARREVTAHAKLFFFDVGIYRALRPRGPLDTPEEIDGASLETLVYQELRAWNAYGGHEYGFHWWRTKAGDEVDLVLYGPDGLIAIEVTRTHLLRGRDFEGLRAFGEDYPQARRLLLYGGTRTYIDKGVTVVGIEAFLTALNRWLR